MSVIESTVGEIRSIAPETVVAYREKLKERITEALNGVQIDEARLLNEVAFYSDKVSIDEEITRLNSHCGHLRKMLDADLPMGKRIWTFWCRNSTAKPTRSAANATISALRNASLS
ncbi:MAG: DUF1732 domain-containing protein [Clostridiales bacterium]|nr:MAG: DUF1732 domain-containing protein [Clostridiales bacterium]